MALMRETRGSLRAYFLVAGAVALLMAYRFFTWGAHTTEEVLVLASYAVSGLMFVLAALGLNALLDRFPRILLGGLIVLMCATLAVGVVRGVARDDVISGLRAVAIPALIMLYLVLNVRRLATESSR
ncbi:MAG: hypothetical protein KC561_16390 [Myxococcales bacterium]|nr:hypothetical protein [Myxococcales bacterium]